MLWCSQRPGARDPRPSLPTHSFWTGTAAPPLSVCLSVWLTVCAMSCCQGFVTTASSSPQGKYVPQTLKRFYHSFELYSGLCVERKSNHMLYVPCKALQVGTPAAVSLNYVAPHSSSKTPQSHTFGSGTGGLTSFSVSDRTPRLFIKELELRFFSIAAS